MFEKYAMIVVYFGVLIFLGYLASRRIRNMNDFVILAKIKNKKATCMILHICRDNKKHE